MERTSQSEEAGSENVLAFKAKSESTFDELKDSWNDWDLDDFVESPSDDQAISTEDVLNDLEGLFSSCAEQQEEMLHGLEFRLNELAEIQEKMSYYLDDLNSRLNFS